LHVVTSYLTHSAISFNPSAGYPLIYPNITYQRLLMKKRKLQRSHRVKSKTKSSKDHVISLKAESVAKSAAAGEATIDCIGNFIFFSTDSGQAWMLDHRNNYALRLADNRKILNYRINESKEKFQVEWKERFIIKNNQFYIQGKDKYELINGCPVDAIEGIITLLQKKQEKPKSA